MNSRQIECDDSRLAILLSGNERSDEFRQLAAHLESCADCRDRLTVLAADCETWDDVSSLLREYEQVDDFAADYSASPPGAPDLDLDFLSPPSHPEMLGRLGRYEIEKVIGSGGMGIVLKGYDTELNRPVAIKVLASYLAHSGAARQRFAREGRAAAAVVHEHVVAIHNVETDAELPFLVMRYVPGQSLQTRVDAQGPLAIKEILRIGIQAAAGLSAAHAQGVVHRDIKPSNILLENDVERALLTDFGLARAADDATVTRTGVIAGTPHYMSPEQASGGPIDQRSDLFSLGALLYFMATGHPPFRAERALAVLNRICNDRHRPVWEINPDVPDELSDIIDRLLEKKSDRRFTGAEQTRDALLKLLEKLQQPGAYRRRPRIRRWLRQRQRRLVVGLSAIVGATLLVALGLSGGFDLNSSGVAASNPSGAVDPQQAGAEGKISPAVVPPQLAPSNALATNSSPGPTNGFVAELAETQSILREAESASRTNTGLLWQAGGADWHSEVEELKYRLSQIEKSLLNDLQSQGAE